ncbi:MAG: cation:proton antiporter [Culicoidibacterales bacterium]
MMLVTLLALVIIGLVAYFAGNVTAKIHLPPLIGIIFIGLLFGPSMLNYVPMQTQIVAPLIKDFALVIVLFIAGLGISLPQLKTIGRPAILLSVLPATLEALTIALISIPLLGFSFILGGITGSIIAAVSPAVLIPAMIELIEKRRGTSKLIPQMLIVGASADDTVALTGFTIFMSLQLSAMQSSPTNLFITLLLIPFSIVIALIISWILAKIHYHITVNCHPIIKIGTILFIIFFLRYSETVLLLSWFNSLLTIMFFGVFLHLNDYQFANLAKKRLQVGWKYGQLYLFFFVGMVLDLPLIVRFLPVCLLILLLSLTMRSVGVYLSLIKTDLSTKEKIFCIAAYLPKATVQSAKSGIPLQYGIPGGDIMQALALTSVIITAPIGALAIKILGAKNLTQD